MFEKAHGTDSKFTLLRVVLFWFCCMAVFASVGPLLKFLPEKWSLLLTIAITCIVTIGLTTLFIRWEKLHLKDVGLIPGKHSISRVLIGFAAGLLLPGLQVALVLLTGHVKMVLTPNITLNEVLLTLLLFMLLSCREELAFRAYPLRSLNYKTGAKAALFIVALMFGIEHVIGGSSWLYGLAGAGVGSLLYGIAALKTKGLALPIGLHAAWNFGQWVFGFKGNAGIWKAVIDTEYKDQVEIISFISYLVAMGLGIVAVNFFWRRKMGRRNDYSQPPAIEHQ